MEIYCVEKNITSQVGHLSPSTLYLWYVTFDLMFIKENVFSKK